MARVRCIMMQKNETLLLEPWFRFYGYLFGFENLTVFDNGSTDAGVLEVLATYEAAGCDVRRGHDQVGDFHGKGHHFGNIIGHWDASSEYDFALPVDCDEFIGVFDAAGFGCGRAAVHAHFDELIGIRSALGMSHNFLNDPLVAGQFTFEEYPKSFLPARSIGSLDHGFHAATSRLDAGRHETKFAYVHLHNKPFEQLLRHARDKLSRFVDVSDAAALRSYGGPGLHLTRYFRMDAIEYERQNEGRMAVCVPQFAELMRALGVTCEMVGRTDRPAGEHREAIPILFGPGLEPEGRERRLFDGRTYVHLHGDVRASASAPLKHYLLYGIAEGRALTPGAATVPA